MVFVDMLRDYDLKPKRFGFCARDGCDNLYCVRTIWIFLSFGTVYEKDKFIFWRFYFWDYFYIQAFLPFLCDLNIWKFCNLMRQAMLNQVLLYSGSAFILFWGVAHLFPTRSVVSGFGEISIDNKRIIIIVKHDIAIEAEIKKWE